MKPAEIRTTLILLAVVFGISVSLLAGKALLYTNPDPIAPVAPVAVVPLQPSAEPVRAPEPAVAEPAAAEPVVVVPALTPAVTPAVAEPAVVAPAVTENKPAIQSTPAKPVNTASRPSVATKPVNTATRPATAPVTTVVPASTQSSASMSATSSRVTARTPIERPARPKKGYLVFVFDDAGHNLQQLDPFLSLPFPCTIAVLPGLQYSGEAARKIRAAGKSVILHQPMQAINRSMDPGPGAITAGMSADQIRALVRKNLAEVGPVVGINNHEGSLITADRNAMEAVFDVVREKGIWFLDSRTNAETVAPILARERNMTIWERSVFLDNSQDKADILEAISGGMKIAEKKGSAIMIGHIWSNDLANILTSMYPELVSQGFSLSTIAEIATNGEFDE